jgi:hypothetical protein
MTLAMTTTITIPGVTLRRLLEAVLPHASEDKGLAACNAVQFEVRDGVLYLAASDQHTLGVARWRPHADIPSPADAEALISLDDACHLRETLQNGGPDAILAFGDGLEAVTPAGARTYPVLMIPGRVRADGAVIKDTRVTFTDWRRIIREAFTAGPAELGDRYGLPPERIARFTTPPSAWEPLYMRTCAPYENRRSPVVLVTRGEWFLGAVMPKGTDGGGYWDRWATICAPATREPADA